MSTLSEVVVEAVVVKDEILVAYTISVGLIVAFLLLSESIVHPLGSKHKLLNSL